MASDKPAILLLCGGWHTPESYAKLIKALEAAGHDVHCPRHPSTKQERPPTASLAEDTVSMRAYVTKLVDEGRRVVAIAHSYGGQIASNSLYGLGLDARKEKGLPGGVSDIVYMAAFALPEGTSMNDKVKEMGHEELMPLAFDFADDMTVVCRDPKTQLIGEHPDEKEVEEYLGSLVRWNGQCMYDPIAHSAWKEIPVTYIHTINDATVPLDYQKSVVRLVEGTGKKVKTYELETGHCPNLTATAAVVEIINEVAR